MILTEEVRTPSGTILLRSWSSRGLDLLQEDTGNRYSEALDPLHSGRSYIEVEPEPEEEPQSEDEAQ